MKSINLNMKQQINQSFIKRVKEILKMSIPLMIQGLVFQMQSLTDKAFLGNLDTKYVSAIGSASLPFNACMDSFAAISTGLIILVSISFGAKKYDEMESFIKSTAFYNGVLGIGLFCMWQLFVSKLLFILHVDEPIVSFGIMYIRICSIYLLFAGLDGAFQAMLQGIGKTKAIMYAGIIKVVINILISWILIFGRFGLPRMNVVGAAIGTLVANMMSFIFVIIYVYKNIGAKYHLFILNRKWIAIKPYIKMIKLGLPVGLEFLLWNFTNLILVSFINGFGYVKMAIYTLTFGCQCIVYVAIAGVAKGMMTLIGQKKGAGEFKAAEQVFYTGICINFIFVILGALLFFIMPQSILSIFSNDDSVIMQGVPYLICIGMILFPQSLNIACGGAIRANGNTKWMLSTQIVGSTIVLSLSYGLINLLHMEMIAVYITLFVDETVRGLMNLVYYRVKYSVKNKQP